MERRRQRVSLGEGLDGDGDLDAIVCFSNHPSEVWLNDGDGNFSDNGQRLGSLEYRDYKVLLGDLDADGDLDGLVSAWSTPPEIWLSDGQASFAGSGQRLETSTPMRATALGDLDGDGDLDALVLSGDRLTRSG